MTNHELGQKLSVLIRKERKITNEILELISLALERRSYLELGFSSMFDWLVKGFGYSSSAAYRRIEAARLLKAVPEASQKLEDGRVNLSTLAKAQSVIRYQEKISGKKVSAEVKGEIVKSIENKSAIETEQTLISIFPEAASEVKQERRTVINAHEIRHQMNLSNEAALNLKRAKEILSHKLPHATDADIVTYALEFLLEKTDPLRRRDKPRAKPVRSSENNPTPSKAAQRRLKIKSAQGQCTFKNPRTGHVCASRYQVQLDHIIPKALGGGDHSSNLRLLCRQHNLLMAERVFGKTLMNRYRT